MTLQEAGLRLRTQWRELERFNLSDENLAVLILNKYQRLYKLVSPVAYRIKEISERIPSSGRWTEKGRLESIQTQVGINRQEAESMLYMDTAIRAAGEGVGVQTYEQMKLNEHHLHGEMAMKTHEYELERKKDNDALDAANRQLLTLHELIDNLHRTLEVLIDEHDQENHPLKKQAKKIRIDSLMEELRGRTKAAAVQAQGGEGMASNVEDTHQPGDNRDQTEDGLE